MFRRMDCLGKTDCVQPSHHKGAEMLGTDGKEYKRKYARESTSIQATLMVDEDWHDCRILNISVGGAKLQIDRRLGHGVAVVLQIGNFGQYNAIVAWQQEDEFGVNFSHNAEEMGDVIMGLASYG